MKTQISCCFLCDVPKMHPYPSRDGQLPGTAYELPGLPRPPASHASRAQQQEGELCKGTGSGLFCTLTSPQCLDRGHTVDAHCWSDA